MKRVLTAAGAPFDFTPDNQQKVKTIMARYPHGREASAILPLLDLAQRQMGGWLSQEAMEHVADLLGILPLKAYEIASFYTMFNLSPRGRYLLQVCTTTPCGLCGAERLMKTAEDKLGIQNKETTQDGLFTLMEVECLGACRNGPVVQVNDDYYEDLTPESFSDLLDQCAAGTLSPPLGNHKTAREGKERTPQPHRTGKKDPSHD